MAGKHSFKVFQGDTWNNLITLSNSSGAIDLTGYDALLQVRHTITGEVLLDLDNDNQGLLMATPTNGQIQINATAEQMASLPSGVYNYQLQITSGAGITSTMLYGSLTVIGDLAS